MSKGKLIVIVVAVLSVVLVTVSVAVGVGIGISGNNEDSTTIQNVPTTAQQPVNAVPQTTMETQNTDDSTIATTFAVDDSELSELLLKAGYSFEDITNTRQLIVVTSDNEEYKIQCYNLNNGVWQKNSIASKAFVGKNGTISADKKKEGDYYSPQGLYSMGFAFGTSKNPGTSMEYRDVYEGIYWVDDSASQYYNMWVDGNTKEEDWNSAEKMWSYDEYIYGAVINYNTDPIVKNKGSAIFLHVGANYTAGCIASDEETIVEILKWLNPESNPQILIY